MTMAGHDTLRIALAIQAYRSGTVRLAEPDLAGHTHLVATRHGLFATDGESLRLIAHGLFYGLTLTSDAIVAFEACDRPRNATRRGRLVRFRREGDRIVGADILADGLDNGCHQIDLVGDRLCVVDTYAQRIMRYPIGAGAPEVLRPVPGAEASDWASGYAHVNSVLARDGEVLLMLHNGAVRTGRPSEIARLDRDWRLVERITVDGHGCHSLAVLEDGAVLTCGSFAGELIATDGLKIRVCDMMTRGLSVGDDVIAVGGSAFADRYERDTANGAVFFLDRQYRSLGRVTVPAPVMEIRRIDGRDRSLSRHLEALAVATPV